MTNSRNKKKNSSENLKIYGSLTTGAGSRLNKHTYFSYGKLSIKQYKKTIIKDLKRTKIPFKKNYNILDVGTGRQALAFCSMTNGQVDHFDLSKENVRQTKKYANKYKYKNLKSVNVNLDYYNKHKKKFYDLIYLQGIIQHFKNPQITLEKILRSLKIGGYAWLYFYKSGTFFQFICYLLRDCVNEYFKHKINFIFVKKTKQFLIKKNSSFKNKKLIDLFIDSVFTPYSFLYNYNKIYKCFEKSGFKIISKISCHKNKQDYDHTDHRAAFIFSVIRKKDKKIDLNQISPKHTINQFKINYGNSKNIKETLKMYKLFKKNIKNLSDNQKIELIFKFYTQMIIIHKYKDQHLKHNKIRFFLKKILN